MMSIYSGKKFILIEGGVRCNKGKEVGMGLSLRDRAYRQWPLRACGPCPLPESLPSRISVQLQVCGSQDQGREQKPQWPEAGQTLPAGPAVLLTINQSHVNIT